MIGPATLVGLADRAGNFVQNLPSRITDREGWQDWCNEHRDDIGDWWQDNAGDFDDWFDDDWWDNRRC